MISAGSTLSAAAIFRIVLYRGDLRPASISTTVRGDTWASFASCFIEGYNFEQKVLSPATLTLLPAEKPRAYMIDVLSGWPRHPPNVRVYAGQPDASDPSHFTVRYEMWGKSDVLDGRLDDKDNVTLTPRNPPQARTCSRCDGRTRAFTSCCYA